MKRFNRVKLIAVLGADLISVQVPLGLPCGPIEEVHGLEEPRCCHCGLARNRGLHRVIMVEAALIGNLLSQVVAGLETGVRESLSRSRGHLGVLDARVRDGQRGLAVPIMDGMHGAICTRDSGSVETCRSEGVCLLI